MRNKQFRALRNLHVDPLSLHTSMRNKQVEFNPYIYTLTTLSKLYRFGYEISGFFLLQITRSVFYGRHYSSLHRLMSLHGKLNVKSFLMFIVAENTRSVNIVKYHLYLTNRNRGHGRDLTLSLKPYAKRNLILSKNVNGAITLRNCFFPTKSYSTCVINWFKGLPGCFFTRSSLLKSSNNLEPMCSNVNIKSS